MDPNANLSEMLELAHKVQNDPYRWMSAERLAELVLALDQWIRKGGAIPDQWLAARIKVMPSPIQEPLCGSVRYMMNGEGPTSTHCCILNQGHEGPHCLEVE